MVHSALTLGVPSKLMIVLPSQILKFCSVTPSPSALCVLLCIQLETCAPHQRVFIFFAAQPNERLSLVGHLDPSQLDEN